MANGKKDMKKLLLELRRSGWSVEQGRKHFKVRSPEGQLFTASASPSCPYAHQNLLRDIRKYRKATA